MYKVIRANEKIQEMKVLIMADRVAGIVIFRDMNVVEHYGEVTVSLDINSNFPNVYNICVCSSSPPTVLICDERNYYNII